MAANRAFAKGTSVLVTGGAGYIGSHICKALSAAWYIPITLDNLSTGHRWAVKWGPLEVGDIRDAYFLHSVMRRYRTTAVLHFAALSLVGESSRRVREYYDVNVGGAIALSQAMEECGVRRLVFSSSCAVYGRPRRLPISEDETGHPLNAYGRTKLAAENLFFDLARADLIDVVALRYFNAAGADFDGEIGEAHDPETHLIPLAIAAAYDKGRELNVFGNDYATPDGTCIRDYIHVMDLASAHIAALRFLRKNRGAHAFNLGTGQGISVREIIASVERVTGRAMAVVERPRREGDPERLYASSIEAQRRLSWTAEFTDIDAIVSSAARWHQLRSSWKDLSETPVLSATSR
jgi:UDP-arabinose 4-epimerase